MGQGGGVEDVDTILNEFGQFGKYQLINYALICIPIILCGPFILSYIFTAGIVSYRCSVPECDSASSLYLEPWLNNTVPFVNGVPSECTRYPWKGNSDENLKCSEFNFDTSQTISCNKFIYRNAEQTIQNEWDITCEDEWKLSLVGSISSIGQLVGMPIGGYISDRYGRRSALVLGVTFSAIMGIIRSFSYNYIMFIIFEFLTLLSACVIFPAGIILGIELVGAKHRILGSTILSVFFPIGEIYLGLLAKYIQNWRRLIQIAFTPGLFIISYYWIIPESVRWLLTKGRVHEAIGMIQKSSKFNNRPISDESLIRLKETALKVVDKQIEVLKLDKEDYPLRLAFKSSKIIWRFINCSFCWMTNAFVYYGLSLNSVTLSGDKYLNFMLTSAVEIPAFLFIYFIMDRLGRRLSQSGSLLICGAACFASIFIEDDQPWAKLATFLIGKLTITISFTVLYVYTSELFPTNLRHSLLSLCSMFGRIGSTVAPQTPLIANYMVSLPMILFGGFAVTSGLLVLRFPETFNTSLPNNITEAEMLGKKEEKTKV